MTRIPPAARTLITQVNGLDSRIEATIASPADGFGVHRTIRFDPRSLPWLEDLLYLVSDHRIETMERVGEPEELRVTFVSDARADYADPFDIEGAAQILRGQRDDEDSVTEVEPD